MRIIVVSDTHGMTDRFEKLVLGMDAEIVLHLGDGVSGCAAVMEKYKQKQFYAVCGNNDFASFDPLWRLLEFQNYRIFMTHGHTLGVKYSLSRLKEYAKQQGASITLYGHTHKSFTTYEEKMQIMNPGSLTWPREGSPTYGMIELHKTGAICQIRRWEE